MHVRETAKERSVSQSGQDFGANDWLVEEMFERYQADPSSVPAEWVTHFQNNPQAGAATSAPQTSAPKGGTPPVPKAVVQPNISMSGAAPVAAVTPTQPVVRNVPATPATPAQPIAKPIPTLATQSGSSLEPIRGVSARVVQSMEASLTVPTATSVRAIPAKLMIDNRIVINNHLKRARGGKVSFTHIIAYAMIKAIRVMPETVNSMVSQRLENQNISI